MARYHFLIWLFNETKVHSNGSPGSAQGAKTRLKNFSDRAVRTKPSRDEWQVVTPGASGQSIRDLYLVSNLNHETIFKDPLLDGGDLRRPVCPVDGGLYL